MKHVIQWYILFLLSNFICGQNLDSLKNELKYSNHSESDLYEINKQLFKHYIYTLPDSALVYAKQMEFHAKNLNDTSKIINSYKMIGFSNEYLNNFDESLNSYHLQLDLSKEHEDSFSIGEAYMNLGIVNKNLGSYKKSIDYQGNASYIFQSLGNKKYEAYCYGNIGVVYNEIGAHEKSIIYFEKCLEIDKSLDDLRGVSISLNNIANVYYFSGNYENALNKWFETLKIDKQLGNKIGESSTLRNLGLCYHDLGDKEEAMKYYQISLQQKRALNQPKSIAKSLNNIGVLYREMGENKKALEYHFEALEIREKNELNRGIAESLQNIATVYLYDQQPDKAYPYLKRALDIRTELKNLAGMSNTYFNIAEYYSQKQQVDSAIYFLNKCYKLSNEINLAIEKRQSLKDLHIIFSSIDSAERATYYLDQLIETRIEDIRMNLLVLPEQKKELYLRKMQDDFDLFYSHTMKHQKENPELTSRAFNHALLIKGLLLKSSTAMRRAIETSNDQQLIKEYDEWLYLKRKIANMYAKVQDIQELEAKADSIEKILIKKSEIISDYASMKSLNYKYVQNQLKKGEYAIEFVRFKWSNNKTMYAALILGKNYKHPKMVLLSSEDELGKTLGNFPGNNKSYIKQLYGTKGSYDTSLYQLIWKPIANEIKNAKTIYLSPTGLLHKVAFNALSGDKKTLLSEEINIRHKTSTKNINSESLKLDDTGVALLFGGINYSEDDKSQKLWKYLEGTLLEVQKIDELMRLNGFESNVLSSSNATEQQFKDLANTSDILHVATHGFFFPDPTQVENYYNNQITHVDSMEFRGGNRNKTNVLSITKNKNPLMRSGLVFANGNKAFSEEKTSENDGILTAQELLSLDLNKTKLAVLSACETGLGDIKGSEGVYGLQRAFKMAGAKNIIISLWQIPDKETAEFMSDFYEQLFLQKDISKAFYSTQRMMAKKHDPYFWAGFILVD